MWLCIAQHLTKPQLTLIRETTLQKVLMHCTLENQIIMHFKHSWSHCQLALSCLQVQWQVTGWCSGQGFSYSFLPEPTPEYTNTMHCGWMCCQGLTKYEETDTTGGVSPWHVWSYQLAPIAALLWCFAQVKACLSFSFFSQASFEHETKPACTSYSMSKEKKTMLVVSVLLAQGNEMCVALKFIIFLSISYFTRFSIIPCGVPHVHLAAV